MRVPVMLERRPITLPDGDVVHLAECAPCDRPYFLEAAQLIVSPATARPRTRSRALSAMMLDGYGSVGRAGCQ